MKGNWPALRDIKDPFISLIACCLMLCRCFFHLPGCVELHCLKSLNQKNPRCYCSSMVHQQAFIFNLLPFSQSFISWMYVIRSEHTIVLGVILECDIRNISPMHTFMPVNFSIINKSYFPTWVLNHGWNHTVLFQFRPEFPVDFMTWASAP